MVACTKMSAVTKMFAMATAAFCILAGLPPAWGQQDASAHNTQTRGPFRDRRSRRLCPAGQNPCQLGR